VKAIKAKKVSGKKMKYPILILCYNRIDLLKTCIENLISLGQTDLYVSIDGPRNGSDFQKQEVMLEYLAATSSELGHIEIITKPKNLGCKLGVISGIDWFLTLVDSGVILEDDCIPDAGFFEFLDNHESKVQANSKIGMITAHNPFKFTESEIPFVTRYSFVTGWYTTQKIWENIRSGMFSLDLPVRRNNRDSKQSISEMIFWWAAATRAKLGFYDTWDSCFSLQMWKRGYMCLVPPRNLISNIGFGPGATHTTDEAATIFIENFENLVVNQDNFDKLLKSSYFKISQEHAIRPLIRVGFEMLKIKWHEFVVNKLGSGQGEFPRKSNSGPTDG